MLVGKVSRNDGSVYEFQEIIPVTKHDLLKAIEALISNNADGHSFSFNISRHRRPKD